MTFLHGRPSEIKALFPHAAQVARVIRTRTVTSWKYDGKKRTRVTKTSTETVYVITSLTAREADPEYDNPLLHALLRLTPAL